MSFFYSQTLLLISPCAACFLPIFWYFPLSVRSGLSQWDIRLPFLCSSFWYYYQNQFISVCMCSVFYISIPQVDVTVCHTDLMDAHSILYMPPSIGCDVISDKRRSGFLRIGFVLHNIIVIYYVLFYRHLNLIFIQ